jgi:hypothetical protein
VDAPNGLTRTERAALAVSRVPPVGDPSRSPIPPLRWRGLGRCSGLAVGLRGLSARSSPGERTVERTGRRLGQWPQSSSLEGGRRRSKRHESKGRREASRLAGWERL